MNSRTLSACLVVLACGLGLRAFAFTPSTTEVEGRHVPILEWDTTLNKFQFDSDKFIGQRFTGACPPAPSAADATALDPATVFDSKSSICQSALQTGAISKEGGLATVQLNPTAPAHGGAEGASAKRTMVVLGSADEDAAAQVYRDKIKRIDWDTKFTATGYGYKHLVGQRFSFQCPSAPSNMVERRVVGTDSYAFSSIICRAAVHAGAITTDGGLVTVQMDPGNVKLSGSVRNGMETHDGSSGLAALSFVGNPAGA